MDEEKLETFPTLFIMDVGKCSAIDPPPLNRCGGSYDACTAISGKTVCSDG
jgi:hypothetical protein